MLGYRKSLWLFLLPPLVGLVIFHILPFIGGFWISLTDGTFQGHIVGVNNYINVWKNQMFQTGLVNSLILAVISIPLIWLFSLLMAFVLYKCSHASRILRQTIMLPYLIPEAATLLILLILFDYGGLANRLLSVFGIGRISWVEGGALRFPIIVFYIWKNLGLSTILFLAAFETIPVALFEYARLEGASWRKQIFSIALPMIAPTAGAVAMISWINSFSISQQIYSVGGAYPGMQMYTVQNFMSNMYNQFNNPAATAAAYSFALIVFLVTGSVYLFYRKVVAIKR